jgi:hypothetical protein
MRVPIVYDIEHYLAVARTDEFRLWIANRAQRVGRSLAIL